MSVIRGAHGAVRRGTRGDQPVAIKECVASEAARQELKFLKKLQGHPHIIPLLEDEERDGSIFMTMECHPVTLLSLLKPGKGFSEHQCRQIFFQLLDVVSHIHDHSLVHKDIKLENILMTDGKIYLIDFGFTVPFVKGERTLCDDKGSLHYCAPELWHGIPYEGPSVDVWAMGVTLFALATGFFPFGGQSAQQIYENIQRPLRFPSCLGRMSSFITLLEGMLEADMSKRLTIEQIYSHPWVSGHILREGLRRSQSLDAACGLRVSKTDPAPFVPRYSTLSPQDLPKLWNPEKVPVVPRSSNTEKTQHLTERAIAPSSETRKKGMVSRVRRIFGL